MRNRTCAWAPPWIPLLCQQTRGTVWLKRHDRMIDRAGPFIKPCESAVSSMPHYCRSPQAQELFWTGSKKVLDKGRLIISPRMTSSPSSFHGGRSPDVARAHPGYEASRLILLFCIFFDTWALNA